MSELWPTRTKAKAAEETLIDDLMGRIEALVTAGQVSELQTLVRDLGELILAVKDLIGKMETAKAYKIGIKAQDVSEAMADIRKRIGTGSQQPPKGREVLASMARWVLERGG